MRFNGIVSRLRACDDAFGYRVVSNLLLDVGGNPKWLDLKVIALRLMGGLGVG